MHRQQPGKAWHWHHTGMQPKPHLYTETDRQSQKHSHNNACGLHILKSRSKPPSASVAKTGLTAAKMQQFTRTQPTPRAQKQHVTATQVQPIGSKICAALARALTALLSYMSCLRLECNSRQEYEMQENLSLLCSQSNIQSSKPHLVTCCTHQAKVYLTLRSASQCVRVGPCRQEDALLCKERPCTLLQCSLSVLILKRLIHVLVAGSFMCCEFAWAPAIHRWENLNDYIRHLQRGAQHVSHLLLLSSQFNDQSPEGSGAHYTAYGVDLSLCKVHLKNQRRPAHAICSCSAAGRQQTRDRCSQRTANGSQS